MPADQLDRVEASCRMRILVIEDDEGLGQAVQEHLRASGHAVDLVHSAEEASAALSVAAHDLIVLDLGLPGGATAGLGLLRALRGRGDWRPVIVATARDQISDRIAGLQAGADDYLVKPFDLGELQARADAVARRIKVRPDGRYTYDGVYLDLADRRAVVDGREVTLTAREWAILERLVRRPGASVSRPQIEEALYEFGAEIESNAVEVYISRLRKKLRPELIETRRGVGYRVPA